jgi:urease accessory protein
MDSHGGLSLIVLLLSGGLLDGDHVSIDVVVEPGARLALRTQAATQVHAGCSSQTLCGQVGDRAWFSYVPHALVPHAGADHHTRTTVTMESGARVMVADVLSPGRVEHGEEFAYNQVRLDLDVCCAGRLVARERALVRPEPSLRQARFGDFTHTAGVYVLGEGEAPTPAREDTLQLGVTELAHGGWYVRALANRAADLEAALGQLHRRWWCY